MIIYLNRSRNGTVASTFAVYLCQERKANENKEKWLEKRKIKTKI